MTNKLNPFTNTEMEILTRTEVEAEARVAGCTEDRVNAILHRYFSNGQDFAWAEYVRESIAKAPKAKPQTTSEKFGLTALDTGDDLLN